MTFRTKMMGVGMAVAMTFGATSASATTQIITLSGAGGSGSATFSNAPGSNVHFSDQFVFTLPKAGTVSLLLTSAITTALTNVNFATNGVKFDGIKLVRELTGAVERQTLFTTVGSAGTYTLSVHGASQTNGVYSGSLVFAIPEAATWAMMILGLGMTGAAMRVRRSKVVFAAA